ncbi:MAG: 1-deoxy-D-xylulose-5-phosphate reductoisomerase [Gemmatimonadota bacterium]|nr:1-deoxy-D-xylulose-5-phosphate reductoisomerase [Gemmatimonadota bacterium]
MSQGVAVLGCTGSIGESTLNVLARHPDRFNAVALTAFSSEDDLTAKAAASGAKFVGLVEGSAQWEAGGNGSVERSVGAKCLEEAATHPDVDIVVNAVVGAAGLRSTLAALHAGKRVALANKETLVMAGDLVDSAAKAGGGELVPVDSEHSGVLQCLNGKNPQDISRLILTASGGPFRTWNKDDVYNATVEQALDHPTWQMGRKITVDSASLVNKALEVIEAHFLFGLPYESIEVVVHPQSIIHAFAEFVDGSILAQMGYPSMELPILYSLTYPHRIEDSGVVRFDPATAGDLTFEAVRHDTFPAFELGIAAGKTGGTAPAVFNAANEVGVQAFLDGKIRFGKIAEVIRTSLEKHDVTEAIDLEVVLAADSWARRAAEEACS